MQSRELTTRGLVLGALITTVFTAANVYLGLKVGLTFARSTTLAPHAVTLTAIAVPFVFIVGFLIAGVCGYMAGLIGASNSPISGVGILAIVICASILAAVMPLSAESRPALVAFARAM